MSRVVTFANVAGISATPRTILTATPGEAVAAPVGESSPPPLLRLNQLEPWRLVALGVLAIGLVGIFIFGYRCWKADCLAKLQP
jgi:hypothetical protein